MGATLSLATAHAARLAATLSLARVHAAKLAATLSKKGRAHVARLADPTESRLPSSQHSSHLHADLNQVSRYRNKLPHAASCQPDGQANRQRQRGVRRCPQTLLRQASQLLKGQHSDAGVGHVAQHSRGQASVAALDGHAGEQ